MRHWVTQPGVGAGGCVCPTCELAERALPSSLQREGLEQLRGYESESERRYMVEYEYAMYAPYHPDLTDVASFEV